MILVEDARFYDMMHAPQIGCLSFVLSLCSSHAGFAADIATTAPSDPFAYCSAMRSIDVPAGGSSPIPAVLAPYLARTLGLQPNTAMAPQNYYWRCMDGAIYVCAVGANMPCGAKADSAKGNVGARNYCRENRDAIFVPAYATGHASIYSWSCSAGRAVRGKQASKIDPRGFRADIWYRVAHE
jgi:hypothetical protein